MRHFILIPQRRKKNGCSCPNIGALKNLKGLQPPPIPALYACVRPKNKTATPPKEYICVCVCVRGRVRARVCLCVNVLYKATFGENCVF